MGLEAYSEVRKAHLEVRAELEALPEVWEGLGGPPTGAGGVMRPTQRFERPIQRSGLDQEAHP